MSDFREETPKVRRFALTTGVLLLTFTAAGVQVGSVVELAGFKLILLRPHLISLGLAVAAAWSAARYFYFAMLLDVAPMQARWRLRRGRLPDLATVGIPDVGSDPKMMTSKSIQRVIDRYYPGGRTKHEMFNQGTGWEFRITSLPWSERILAAFETVDFTAPVWLNALAIAIWVATFLL